MKIRSQEPGVRMQEKEEKRLKTEDRRQESESGNNQ
jgi:hypothetical protein